MRLFLRGRQEAVDRSFNGPAGIEEVLQIKQPVKAGMVKAAQITLGSRLLMNGSKGTDVKELQELLIGLGYDVGSTGADGKFGKNTESGVIAFQKKNRLTADGKYGEKTHAALMAAVGQTETTEEEDTNEKPVTKSVVLHATDGKVNIRFGNGDEYGLMTTVTDGTEVPYVATADNAWMAVAVNGMVGWVKTE